MLSLLALLAASSPAEARLPDPALVALRRGDCPTALKALSGISGLEAAVAKARCGDSSSLESSLGAGGPLEPYARLLVAESLLGKDDARAESLLRGQTLPGSAGLRLRLVRDRALINLGKSLDARDDLRALSSQGLVGADSGETPSALLCLMTLKEAAGLLRLSERALYDLARQRRLPSVQLGGKWLFPRAALTLRPAHSEALKGLEGALMRARAKAPPTSEASKRLDEQLSDHCALLATSCASVGGFACRVLAVMPGVAATPPTPAMQVELLERACDGDDVEACLLLPDDDAAADPP